MSAPAPVPASWALTVPPNTAAPIDCPTWRMNDMVEVATPRCAQPTLPWIATVKVLLVRPMPTPMKPAPKAATSAPLAGLERDHETLPSSSGTVPMSVVVR